MITAMFVLVGLSLVSPPLPLRSAVVGTLPRRVSHLFALASTIPAEPPPQLAPVVLKPSKIQRGDFVIHKRYGVGRFEGLFQKREITIQWDEEGNEFEFHAKFLRIKFRDGDLELRIEDRNDVKLFKRKAEEEMESIPVTLDSMRSRKSWERRKAKVRPLRTRATSCCGQSSSYSPTRQATSGVFAVANDLLKMYAERQALTRPPCQPDGAPL